MPNALVQQVGRATVLVLMSASVSPSEWSAVVEQLRTLPLHLPEVWTIVWTDGQLDSSQRREVIEMIKRRPIVPATGKRQWSRALMFTSSVVSRGVMQALGWMGANINSFAKPDLFKGLRAEGFAADEAAAIHAAIVALEAEILPTLTEIDRTVALRKPLAKSVSSSTMSSLPSSSP